MKKMMGGVLFLLLLIGAYLFIKTWRNTLSLGVGTGNIAHRTGTKPGADEKSAASSKIREVSENPAKFAGKRITISGRVRGNTKYASNRNLYKLTDGQYSLLVVDDKAAPIEYSNRSVAGIVKVVKPPVGQGYAYIVSVQGNPNINLKWTDVSAFFSDKLKDVKKGI